ncbi:MAG: hypothetical protein ACOCRX_11340, partial [Candidatus Woesearchaeota archaeon]
ENLPLIRKFQNQTEPDFIGLTYEDLLMHPKRVISFLSDKLDLPQQDKMLEQIEEPSSTVRYSNDQTKNHLNNYNKEYLLKKWKNKVSAQEEKNIFEIIEHFGIDIYKPREFMPAKKFLL